MTTAAKGTSKLDKILRVKHGSIQHDTVRGEGGGYGTGGGRLVGSDH